MGKEKIKAVVFDFDGTIADYSHREQYRNIDFQRYIDESPNDVPIPQTCEIMNQFRGSYQIIILTARDEVCYDDTVAWLKKYDIYYDKLILKPHDFDFKGDNDFMIKKNMFMKVMEDYDIFFAIDDRSSVVNMLRRDLGLRVFQCGEGY